MVFIEQDMIIMVVLRFFMSIIILVLYGFLAIAIVAKLIGWRVREFFYETVFLK